MSIAAVVTRGYGSFSTVYNVPVRGYLVSSDGATGLVSANMMAGRPSLTATGTKSESAISGSRPSAGIN